MERGQAEKAFFWGVGGEVVVVGGRGEVGLTLVCK